MPYDGSQLDDTTYDGSQLDDTTKLLIAARGMVERGWCQHKIGIGGQVCAVGALTRSVSAWPASNGVLNGAMRHLGRAIGFAPIPIWNDAPERTQADVLAAYDIAIAASLSGNV